MKAKFLLLTACVCVGMPCWAEDREESAVETAYNQAFDQWMLGLTRFLAEQESPLVRVLGSWHLDNLSRKQPALKGEGRKIRASAIKDGWSNPAVVLGVYGTDCVRGPLGDECNPSAVQAQLLETDPDNAVSVLLPWLYPSEKSARTIQLDAENVATIVEAAGKGKFDLYLTAGFHDAYLEIARYESQHQQPEIPQELLAQLNEQGFQLPADPLWSPSLSIMASAFAFNGGAAFSRLFDVCGQAQSENHPTAIRACLDLADLMQGHSKSFIEAVMGHGLQKRTERPRYVGAINDLEDPEGWRDQIRQLEFECARPRMIDGLSLDHMPADHWSRYVQDLQESGERVASQQAAEREYAEFPESYEMDPADCSRIYDLDEETQQRLAREQEIKRLGDVLRALDNGTVIDLAE